MKEIEAGNILTFKGGLNDKVCLCTRNKTFEIKNAEQSNSLVVIPDLLLAEKTSTSPLKSPVSSGAINKSLDKSLENEDEEGSQEDNFAIREILHKPILRVFYNYLEAREIKPNVKKIQELLHLTLYNGPENEHLIEKKHLFTRRQLFETSQCSAAEFDMQLLKIRAIKIDGFLRVLDSGYEFRVVTFMTNLINENSWLLNEVDKEVTMNAIEGIIPLEIASAIFNYYAVEISETGKYSYSEAMVCRIIAQNVLQEGLKFHVDEFMETCQGGLPEGMQMKETYLYGIGVIDKDSAMPSISALFEENLPVNLLDRLKRLFQTKVRWTMPEITPYLEVFTTPKLGISALLAKHTRSLTDGGVRYYVSKH